MKTFNLYALIGLLFFVNSCGTNEGKSDNFSQQEKDGLIQSEEAQHGSVKLESGGAPSYAVSLNETNSEQKTKEVENSRKLIKEGDIKFQTPSVKQTKEMICEVTKELGGYISKDNTQNYSGTLETVMTLRVESKNFDKLIQKISSHVKNIDFQNVNIKDVTEEYLDVSARIKNKKALEERYKELLKQARNVEEMMSIESQIGVLRENIESMEGRLNYLKDRISMSSLTIQFYEKPIESMKDEPSAFGGAISKGWNNLMSLFLFIISSWPFLLVCYIAYVIFQRERRKINAKKNE